MSFPSVVRAIIAGERVLPELLEVVMPRIRHPYPSDLSYEEWALLEPLLASSERRGRPPPSGPSGASPTPRSTSFEERLRLADAPAGVIPALADRVLPLAQVAPGRPAA